MMTCFCWREKNQLKSREYKAKCQHVLTFLFVSVILHWSAFILAFKCAHAAHTFPNKLILLLLFFEKKNESKLLRAK